MPNNVTGRLSGIANRVWKVFDFLRVKVNLNVRPRNKAVKLLSQAALGTVPAVYKRRDDAEPQVSGSRSRQVASVRSSLTELVLGVGTRYRATAKGMHLE